MILDEFMHDQTITHREKKGIQSEGHQAVEVSNAKKIFTCRYYVVYRVANMISTESESLFKNILFRYFSSESGMPTI